MDVNAKIDFLEKLLGKYKFSSNTKEAEFFCCFCVHHKPKLSINIENDFYKCWVCGKAGKNLIPILKKVGTKLDIQEYINKYRAKDVKISQNIEKNVDFKLVLPEGFVPIIECRGNILGKKAYDYLIKGRKITDEDILRHKIGTAFDGEYQDKIIFPSFDKRGLVNFFTSRAYDGSYWSPQTPKGYKFGIILNELNLDFDKPMVIVEGFGDMLKSINNTAPLFGSSLPEESLLFKTIVEHFTPVYLALDPDAKKKTDRIAKNFIKYGIEVYNICVEPYKDVGEMTKEEFKERFDVAKPTNNNQILRERIQNL